MITIILLLCAFWLGARIGARWERGRREIELAQYEQQQAERGERNGSYQLNTIRIKR